MATVHYSTLAVADLCGHYVIFFRSVTGGIEVVRIVRGERDLDQF